MRIIGIYLHKETDPLVRKNLEPGHWFPFIQAFHKPIKDQLDYRSRKRRWEANTDVYQVFRDLPRNINICCICGMNGSGKSTLLDILYRILNNFSIALLAHQSEFPCGLSMAKGLYADLYFEMEDQKGEVEPALISCQGERTFFYHGFRGKRWHEIDLNVSSLDGVRDLLQDFFYTIVTNYSVYSLNKKDYEPGPLSSNSSKDIDGEWLDGLFNKNDGYFTPIAISPYRKHGIFDVAREKSLAYQRLTALTLYFKSKGKRFIDGYEAVRLRYKYNKKYKEERLQKLYDEFSYDGFSHQDVEFLLSVFEKCWRNRYAADLSAISRNESEVDTVMFYLSAKALRICRIYPTFREVFNPYEYKGSTSLSLAQDRVDAAIDMMLSDEERSHITVKLRRCVAFTKGNLYHFNDSVDEIDCSLICEKRFSSYDDASVALPPPFFDVELVLAKRRRSGKSSYHVSDESEITFSRMSSGELQFLFCVSHILYHLKNIQSVHSDKYRVRYHHINLIFDEAELYFHPDLQRRFVKMLLESLNKADVDRRSIFSINIIIATHSPFILSDIQGGNILYLENGERRSRVTQTFGANLYDLMKDSFFFNSSAMGEIAEQTIGDIVQKVNQGQSTDDKVERIIGDSAIRSYLDYRRKQNVQDTESET